MNHIYNTVMAAREGVTLENEKKKHEPPPLRPEQKPEPTILSMYYNMLTLPLAFTPRRAA